MGRDELARKLGETWRHPGRGITGSSGVAGCRDAEVAAAVHGHLGHLGQLVPVHLAGGGAYAAGQHAFRGVRSVIVPVIIVTVLDMAGRPS
jgi:hypothetical protein